MFIIRSKQISQTTGSALDGFGWNLLEVACRRTWSQIKMVYVYHPESVVVYQLHTSLKLLFCFYGIDRSTLGKSADDIGGN